MLEVKVVQSPTAVCTRSIMYLARRLGAHVSCLCIYVIVVWYGDRENRYRGVTQSQKSEQELAAPPRTGHVPASASCGPHGSS